MVYVIYPRCYEAEPSNPKGIAYTTASEGSMWLVPQLTAFHQSQPRKAWQSTHAKYPCVTPLGLGSLENKGLKRVGYVIERTRGAVGYGGKPKFPHECAARVGNRGWSSIT